MFEPVKFHGNLSEGIVNQIMQAINNGELKPGDKLPAEREMCTMFSVSRTVIRDALKMLVGLGVITIRHGMGAYINEVDGAEDVSRLASLLHISRGTVEELFQVREVIESQAVLWCTKNANEQDLRLLQHIDEFVYNKDAGTMQCPEGDIWQCVAKSEMGSMGISIITICFSVYLMSFL